MAKFRILKSLTLQPLAPPNARVMASYLNPVTIPAGTIVEGAVRKNMPSCPVGATCITSMPAPTLMFTYNGKNFSTPIGTYEEVINHYPNGVPSYTDKIDSAKYKLLKDYSAVDEKNSSWAGGTMPVFKIFKSGDVIEGNLITRTYNDGSVKKFFQPIVDGTKCAWIEESQFPVYFSKGEAVSTKTFFTPKNILIGVLGVFAIYGIYRLVIK